jgi:hypothetical protein
MQTVSEHLAAMKIKLLLIVFSYLSFTSCRETHYNYICTGLGDSSPTELLIINNTEMLIDLTV